MTRLVVKNAIEYYAASKSPTFTINIPDAMMMQAGVVFRSNDTINEDGSFDVTIVPWENVVSFTHAMLPPDETEHPLSAYSDADIEAEYRNRNPLHE